MLKRYEGNPILRPIREHSWESLMVYNCAAVYEGGKVHIVYRAQGEKGGKSKLGYAVSNDGFHIDERLEEPIFEPEPNNEFESYGCEDPRLTKIGEHLYVCYSAIGRMPRMTRYSGTIQIGITSIKVSDFLRHQWNWGRRVYPFPRVDNKNACIFPEKINGKFVMYHRIPPHIWIAYSDDLESWYDLKIVMSPIEDWEYFKLGSGPPPIKTNDGWLYIYHAVDCNLHYRLGLALIDLKNPKKVLKRSRKPLLQPEEDYELYGVVPNVVFSCGAVVIGDTLFLYYGGADTVICVATAKVPELLAYLKK